jgi:hypothetical protein
VTLELRVLGAEDDAHSPRAHDGENPITTETPDFIRPLRGGQKTPVTWQRPVPVPNLCHLGSGTRTGRVRRQRLFVVFARRHGLLGSLLDELRGGDGDLGHGCTA